jgi:hypothetical protein
VYIVINNCVTVEPRKTYIHPLNRKCVAIKKTFSLPLNSCILSNPFIVLGNLLYNFIPTFALLFLKSVVLQNWVRKYSAGSCIIPEVCQFGRYGRCASLKMLMNINGGTSNYRDMTSNFIYIYTGCPRRKGPNFGRVFLRSNYIDITQNTYVQSWMVTEILAREVWNFDSYYSLIDYQIHIETGRNMWFL